VVGERWAATLRRVVKSNRARPHSHAHGPGLNRVLGRIAAYRSGLILNLRTAPITLRKIIPSRMAADARPAPQDLPVPATSASRPDPAGAPGGEASDPESAGPEQPAKAAEAETSKESKRWELIVAVSIATAAVTGAVLTYLAIQKESAAVESDRESVVQTVTVQNQSVAAKIQVDANGALAARYRQLMAEASVLSGTAGDQAELARLNAVGFIANYGVSDYLSGTGATARYDQAAAFQGALAVDSSSTVLPPDEPKLTAEIAARDYATARRIRVSIVSLLGVVVILTIVRLSKTRRWRQGLLTAAVLGYATATVAAVIQVA
jgi:hypothetical protein